MPSKSVCIIDYGMGNLNSVKRKLHRIGVSASITSDANEILNSSKILLPGVGHFSKAIDNLKTLNLWDALNDAVLIKKIPIMGICLGAQLMAKRSEEGNVEGFGWFDGEVVRFDIKDTLKYKVPHMGWNHVVLKKQNPLFEGVDLDPGFYFVHSYHMVCDDPADILNETVYEYPFVSAIQKENIYGLQYHPEKSHDAGERLLKNFVYL